MLKRIEDSPRKVNFIYAKTGENEYHFYETGDNNKEDIEKNTWIGFALRLNSLVDFDSTPEAVELDNEYLQSYDLDPDCSRIPFERDFEINITSSPSNPKQGDSVVLEAIPSEVNSDYIVNYDWDIGDDGSIDDTGQTISTEFSQERTSVSVTTTTDVGTMGEASTIITTSPSIVVTPTFEYQPSTPVAGDPITFDATASTAENTDIRTYEWDFTGDGTADTTGEKAVHTFEEGKHQVSLTVRGTDGTVQKTSQIIDVINERVNIAVTTTDTQLTVDEQVNVQYSVNNYLTSEELTVQLLIETPSGIAVSGVSGAQEGSNQFTAVTTLPSGRQEQIQVNLTANAPGTYTVTAIADYYFGNDQQNGDRTTEELSFTVDPRGCHRTLVTP
jgi:PKD repeat protein